MATTLLLLSTCSVCTIFLSELFARYRIVSAAVDSCVFRSYRHRPVLNDDSRERARGQHTSLSPFASLIETHQKENEQNDEATIMTDKEESRSNGPIDRLIYTVWSRGAGVATRTTRHLPWHPRDFDDNGDDDDDDHNPG